MLNSRSRAALPSPRFFGADPMHAIAESPIYPHREDSMPYSLMAKVSDGNSPSRSVRAVRHPDPVFRNDTLVFMSLLPLVNILPRSFGSGGKSQNKRLAPAGSRREREQLRDLTCSAADAGHPAGKSIGIDLEDHVQRL